MSSEYRPVKMPRISWILLLSSKNLSRAPGLAKACWTFLVPAKWYWMLGDLIASDRSIKSLASHSFSVGY